MKINTKIKFKDITGEEIITEEGKTVSVSDVLPNILLASSGDKMKLFLLAQKIATQSSVEVDQSDMDIIKEAIKSADFRVFTNLLTGQLLVLLNEKTS